MFGARMKQGNRRTIVAKKGSGIGRKRKWIIRRKS
jgi:hypothetical protein